MSQRFAGKVLWFQQHKLSKMKRSTVKTMQGHIGNYLLPVFSNSPLPRLTAERVNEWLSTDSVKHLSPKTMKHLVTTLSLITGIRYGREIRYPNSRVRSEERCFTPEEMTKLIESSEGTYKILYALAAETGCRAGELYALEVGDVDFQRNQIHVRRSVYDGEVQTPKTMNAYRVVDVQPWVIQLLKSHVGDRQGLLLVNKRNHAMRNTTVLRRHLHPLLKRLGLAQGGMHGFRHGRVSYLVEQGVPREIIKSWIGHGSDSMVERYLHLRASYRAAALANVQPLHRIDPTYVPSTSGERVAIAVQAL